MTRSQLQSPALLPFESFLLYLRTQGLSIGVDDHLRIQALLNAAVGAYAPRDLRTLLCPVIARNPQEQALFHEAFDRWFTLFGEAPVSDQAAATPTSETSEGQTRWSRTDRIAGIALLLVASLFAWMLWGGLARKSPPDQTTELPPTTVPSTNAAGSSKADALPPAGELTRPAPTPPVAEPPVSAPQAVAQSIPGTVTRATLYQQHWRLFRWLGVLVPLLALAVFEYFQITRVRLIQRRYEAMNPPSTWPASIPTPPERFRRWPLFRPLARQMRRRQVSDVFRLDMLRTVAQTVRAFGRTSLAYRLDSRPPEYLALIDRVTPQDHFAQHIHAICRSLESEGVFVSTWYFTRDPRRCFRDSGETALLDDLQERSADHRLLVFSTGDALLDPITGRLADWATATALRWKDRTIFTPVAASQWARRELTLARDFLLLPATLGGMKRAIDWFEHDTRHVASTASWDTASDLPAGCQSDEPVELRKYLGEPAFQWLCACAVYPELLWHLTLHLGQLSVMPRELMSEDNLLRLFRLRYFREGAIPERVRLALIRELDPAIERGVHTALIEMLERARSPQGSLAEARRQLRLASERVALNPGDRASRNELRQVAAGLPAHLLRTEAGVQLELSRGTFGGGIRLAGLRRRALFPDPKGWITVARTTRGVLAASIAMAAWSLILPPQIDIWTVAVDNTRQGWNRFETVLTPANVPDLKKIREFPVDEKVSVAPLVVRDRLYVFTMSNTAYVFDVNTGAPLASARQLAPPFDPRSNPGQMDRWLIYHNWGITAAPVIDTETNTLYVATFGKPRADTPNTDRNNVLWILDATTLADKSPPVLIAGDADNGGGGIANGSTMPYQKMRAGLALLEDARGNKALIISFSINAENPRGPGHGFVVAYDVRGLHREFGFTLTPAIWNVTPGGGAGGIWMAGSAPAIDGNDIYIVTGNGMDPRTQPNNFGESFVKLRYTAGAAGRSRPRLDVVDFYSPFSDFGRGDEDRDLGASGLFIIPAHRNVMGGGKDGVLYNLDMDELGKLAQTSQHNQPFVATYVPREPNTAPGRSFQTPADPQSPTVSLDRNLPAQTPDGKSHSLSGSAYIENDAGGIVYVWGDNERVRAYDYDIRSGQVKSRRAEGTHVSSGNMPAPGAVGGGGLTVSSDGTRPGTAVLWGVYPVQGAPNSSIVAGALVAYDATAVVDGKLKPLFHSDSDPGTRLGNFAKFSTPVVANGKVYVATFSNKVVQYGLAAK